MANGELKYWVFHQEALEARLEAYVAERVALGASEVEARAAVFHIRWFLLESDAGKPLLGGRAG